MSEGKEREREMLIERGEEMKRGKNMNQEREGKNEDERRSVAIKRDGREMEGGSEGETTQ